MKALDVDGFGGGYALATNLIEHSRHCFSLPRLKGNGDNAVSNAIISDPPIPAPNFYT
jgi:hypothetical protein